MNLNENDLNFIESIDFKRLSQQSAWLWLKN